MGIDDATIQTGLAKFGGVKRRFTKVGEIAAGGGIATVIDDYGHHPVENTAVLAAARDGEQGRGIAVVHPHRLTRMPEDRESGGEGKRGSVRVDIGVRSIIQK